MQPWFYPVVKYWFNAICFTRFIFVNSVIVSSIISCNDLHQDFITMYTWYFVSRNSISVLGAIWLSLSPCTMHRYKPNTVINPILLIYLLLSHLCGRNGGIKRLVMNCTPSCPKLMTSITRDAEIENMKLLSILSHYVSATWTCSQSRDGVWKANLHYVIGHSTVG